MTARTRNHGQFGCPKYNQAAKIIARFGGEANLARVLGINRVSVYRWQYRQPYGGDGLISRPMADRIREVARLEGVVLTAEDWAVERNEYDAETLANIGTAPKRPYRTQRIPEIASDILK